MEIKDKTVVNGIGNKSSGKDKSQSWFLAKTNGLDKPLGEGKLKLE